MNRREFVSGLGAFAAAGVVNRLFAEPAEDALDVWQRETDLVKAEVKGIFQDPCPGVSRF